MIDNNLGYKLVDGITQSNGSVTFEGSRIRTIRNEAEEGSIIVNMHVGMIKDHFTESDSLAD